MSDGSQGGGIMQLFGTMSEELTNLQSNIAVAIFPSIPGQLAGKYYDISFGIDIHKTIWPPWPVCPVPHFALVFDILGAIAAAISPSLPSPPPPSAGAEAAEGVQELSTTMTVVSFIVNMMKPTVTVNNNWVANAGTTLQTLPMAFFHLLPLVKPIAEAEMFMGSATVLADGSPFCYQFLPALSCSDIGIKAPPRLKKLAGRSMMTPFNSLIITPPKGMPVMVGGPPTIDLMALVMNMGMRGLGKLAQRSIGKLLDKILPHNAMRKIRCFLFGEPVDVATGRVYAENQEFTLPGPIPFVFERTYYSDLEEMTSMGQNWYHSYDVFFKESEDLDIFSLRLGDGRTIGMPRLIAGTSFYRKTEELTWSYDGKRYSYKEKGGLNYVFEEMTGTKQRYNLSEIRNDSGEKISLHYQFDQLKYIIDSANRKINFLYNEASLLESVVVVDEEELPIYTHQYEYEDGLLSKVINAKGISKHFRYNEERRLCHLTNQSGLNFYWEFDKKGRCVHTWGDEGILEYWTQYERGKTIVTDSLGHTTTYLYNEDLLITDIIDPLGNRTKNVYNDAQDIVLNIDPMGQSKKYEYDYYGNLTCITDPYGNNTYFQYDEQHRLLKTHSPTGAVYGREYDDQGRVESIKYPSGNKIVLEYEEGSQPQKIKDKKGRETELFWDKHFNLKATKSPNGAFMQMEYDYLGRMTRSIAPNQSLSEFEYDVLGNLTFAKKADGTVHQFKYNNSDEVIEAFDGKRKVEFTYWGLGNLKSRKENGKTVYFDYDTEEQLKSIKNEHNEVYRFVRDPLGNIIGEWGFDGINRQYLRDANGRVNKTIRANDRYTNYEYDRKGNIRSLMHEDGSFNLFTYNAVNQLIEASNGDYQVILKRDKVGRIVEEKQNGYVVNSEYNEDNQRLGLSSSLGAKIENSFDDLGFLKQRKASQSGASAWQANFEYDILGLEIERDLGNGLKKSQSRDERGRVTNISIQNKNLEGSSRKYTWNAADQLQKIIYGNGEEVEFEYDQIGNLSCGSYNKGIEKIYKCPDAVGNLFKDPKRKDRVYGKSGRLLEDKEFEYKYDDEGFLIQKISKTEYSSAFSLVTTEGDSLKATWTYQWDSGGQLKQVISPAGQRSEYEYDALGRRTAKIINRKEINRYIYDSNVLLHEWSYDISERPKLVVSKDGVLNYDKSEPLPKDLVTWIFDEGSFAPAAKLVGDQQYSIITDYLGTPVEAYDVEGKKVWECELDVYGKVRKVKGEQAFIPFRYQGQYEDKETGLYYNRFRYYSPESGGYISQDPIGLLGNNPNFYGYTFDSNTEVDVFGLDCSKAKKLQNEITDQTKKTAAVVERWLKSSNNKWAKAFRRFEVDNPNFAKLIKGRVIDRRMNKWMTDKYKGMGATFDRTTPGSGRMRPDAYFPDVDGQSVIFDIGGPSKASGIGKYDGLADIVEPIIY